MIFFDMLFELYIKGFLKEDVWYKYCLGVLTQLMEENKEIFLRLKEETYES